MFDNGCSNLSRRTKNRVLAKLSNPHSPVGFEEKPWKWHLNSDSKIIHRRILSPWSSLNTSQFSTFLVFACLCYAFSAHLWGKYAWGSAVSSKMFIAVVLNKPLLGLPMTRAAPLTGKDRPRGPAESQDDQQPWKSLGSPWKTHGRSMFFNWHRRAKAMGKRQTFKDV